MKEKASVIFLLGQSQFVSVYIISSKMIYSAKHTLEKQLTSYNQCLPL